MRPLSRTLAVERGQNVTRGPCNVRYSSTDAAVEPLAQRLVWYLKVHAVESDALRADPTLRGRVSAEIDRHAPDVSAAFAALSSGEYPEKYLEEIDAVMAKIPTTFEDRVHRLLQAAIGAHVYYNQEVIDGIQIHDGTRSRVLMRALAIYGEWRRK